MNVRLIVAAFIVAVLAALAAPRPAAACSCLPPPPPREALAASAAVFEGTVTDVREPAAGEPHELHREVVFQVGRRFKAAEADTVTVVTATSSAACGYEFEPGRTYLVYAGETDGRLMVSLCSRTARIEDAADDLEALGSSASPDPGPAPEPPPPAQPTKRGCGGCTTSAPTDAATAGLLVVLSLALALRRRA